MPNPVIYIEEAIKLQALADPALVAINDDAFYSESFQQGDKQPCVLLQRISTASLCAHDGTSGLEQKRFQMTVRANCVLTCLRIATRLKKIFDGFKGNLAGVIFCGKVRLAGESNMGRNPAENINMYRVDFMFFERIEP